MEDNLIEICVWADYTWCNSDEVEEYTWKSDDYHIAAIQIDPDIGEPTELQLKAIVG